MALPAYKKQYRDPTSNATKNITGAVFEIGKSVPRIGSIVETDSGANYNCQLFPASDQYATASSFLLEFYYDDSICGDVGAQLIKGTAYSSVGEYFDAVWAMLNDKFAHNKTQPGWKSLMTDSNFAARDQGFLKSASSEYILFPMVNYFISRNDFNPGDMTRVVGFGISVVITMSTWSTNTNAWNSSTEKSMAVFNFNGSGSDFTNMKASFDKIANSLRCIAVSPGPYQGNSQTGGEITYNTPTTGQDDIVVFYINEPISTAESYPYIMKRADIGRLGTPAWNQNGSVDPVDPTPTPPDPEPYPPPKPGPDDPPDPVDPVDPVPEPGDPSLDGTNCGIYSVYNPSRTALRQLGEKLWDPNVWEIIKQHFTSPMEALLSLSIIPVPPSTSGTEAIVIGNYNSHVGAPVVNSDYVTFNCGSVYIPKFFGSYLDYDPYTTYKLYLPFIGEVDLNADEITAERITIKYKVNVVSGDCVALCIKRNNVFAEFNGNCARFLPLSQASWAAFVQAAATFASAAIVGGVALAGSGATGEAIESSIGATKNGEIRAAANVAQQQSIGANIASSGINAVVGSKISYNKAGRVGQSAGQISVRTPYITVTRPNLTLPENIDQASSSALRNYIGYPTNRIGQLSSFHGLTVIEACQLNSQHATEEELAEALEIMKGGVIL